MLPSAKSMNMNWFQVHQRSLICPADWRLVSVEILTVFVEAKWSCRTLNNCCIKAACFYSHIWCLKCPGCGRLIKGLGLAWLATQLENCMYFCSCYRIFVLHDFMSQNMFKDSWDTSLIFGLQGKVYSVPWKPVAASVYICSHTVFVSESCQWHCCCWKGCCN